MAKIIGGTTCTPLRPSAGGNIVVDDKLDAKSTNPLQNKVVAEAFSELQDWRDDTDSWIETFDEELATNRVVNVRSYKFGAIGDGKSHPLRERYAALEIAQMIYPNAESLDEEIDGLAIQKALLEAERKGLTLYIPAGTYLASKTITTNTRDTEAGKAKQTKNLHIYGAGGGTIIKTTEDFEGDYVFYLDVYPTNDRSLWVRDFRIEINADTSGIFLREVGMKGVIENLWVRNYYNGENAKVRCGLWCASVVVTTIDKVKVSHFSKGCGIVVQTMHSSKIMDCDVTYCGWAIYLSGGSNNQVTNCRIDHNEYGIFQNSSTDIEVENRAFPYVADPEDDEPQFKGTFGNFTIRKNRFEGNNKCAIYLVSFSGGDLNYMWNVNTVIAENYFTGLGTAINEKTGALLYDEDGNTIFRKAIRIGRCKDIVVEANEFKGEPYNSTNPLSRMQNISNVAGVSNMTLRNNSAISCPRVNENGVMEIVKSNNHIFTELVNQLKLVDNIEHQQASGVTVNTVVRYEPTTLKTGGTIDVSANGVYKLNEGVTVSGIKIEDSATLTESQEITLVAMGAATVNHTSSIRLKGGVNFAMGLYDTLTLVRVYHSGAKWVEKCRTVYNETTE